MKVLGDSLRQNPDSLFTSRKIGNELMDSGKYAYAAVCSMEKSRRFQSFKKVLTFQMEYLLHSFLLEANKRAGYCRFTKSNKNLPIMTHFSVYAFRKNCRFTNLANYKFYYT